MISQHKKAGIAITLSLALVSISWCQNLFVKALGRNVQDLAYRIIQSADGGYCLAGWTGSDQVFIAKFDSIGTYEWSRRLGGTGEERAQGLIQTADEGYVIAGVTGGDILIAKFDSLGNHEWSKALDFSHWGQANALIETADGGYAVGGEMGGNALLTKLDSSWTHEWTRILGGPNWDSAFNLMQTSDRGYGIIGLSESYGEGAWDILVAKFDSSGEYEWARTIGGEQNDHGLCLVQTTDGGYVAVGGGHSYGAGNKDILISRLDSSADHLWSRTVGWTGEDKPREVIRTADGGWTLAGFAGTVGSGGLDVLLVRFDSLWNHQWSRVLGGPSDEKAYGLLRTSDGGYTIGGYTGSYGAGDLDFLLATFDSLGNSCLGEFVTPTISDVSPVVNSISPTIDSVSPIVGDPSLTVNSPGPSVTPVCGTGPAILVCSLWIEPDTMSVFLEEDLYLYMTAENRGFSDADSVVPQMSIFGGENIVLVAGPDPSEANIGLGDQVVFTWTYTAEDSGFVHWEGHALGKDEWSDTLVSSNEAASDTITIRLFEFFKRADVDGDMDVQMSDAIFTLQYLYVPGSPAPDCEDAADADDDGGVVMSDALFTLKYLYVPGSPAPLPPFPYCGADPTMDEVRCLRHSCTIPFIRGDCNGDTAVDLVDVFYILEYVEHGEPVPSCLDATDVDDDGDIDSQDASYLSDYLTEDGPAPPPPFPDCGRDPTTDELGCTEHPCMDGR